MDHVGHALHPWLGHGYAGAMRQSQVRAQATVIAAEACSRENVAGFNAVDRRRGNQRQPASPEDEALELARSDGPGLERECG